MEHEQEILNTTERGLVKHLTKMQRELKFRCWDTEKKVMRTPNDGDFIAWPAPSNWKDFFHVMQYTGLRDKNGKEIFEGDIVKCHDHPTGIEDVIGTVIFDHGRYWTEPCKIPSLDDYGTTAWTEVIGNVYENPELVTRAAGV